MSSRLLCDLCDKPSPDGLLVMRPQKPSTHICAKCETKPISVLLDAMYGKDRGKEAPAA